MTIVIPETHIEEARKALNSAEFALRNAREALRVGPGKRARPDTAMEHVATLAASLDSARVALYAIEGSARSSQP